MAAVALRKLLTAISERLTRDNVKEREIDALRESIMPETSVDNFKLVYKRYSLLLKNITSSDMGDAQLDAYLTSMVKKKDSGFTFDDAWAVGEWWKKEKTSVKSRLEQATIWDQQLVSSRAKIRATVPLPSDSENKSSVADESATKGRVAVLELRTSNPDRVLEFEASKPCLEALLSELRAVDAEIRRCCDASSSS